MVREPSDFLLGSLRTSFCFRRSTPSILRVLYSQAAIIVGGTEYMFDPHLPLFIRLLSLFHVVTPPLLLWAIWRLGYDRRGWKLQTLMAWIVVPINYFWRPEQDVNWARGLFFREQHTIPGWAYLLVYLITVPLLVYFPTHLFLGWFSRRWPARRNAFSP